MRAAIPAQNTIMSSSTPFSVRLLTPNAVSFLQALSTIFGKAFEEEQTYGGAPPSEEYLTGLLRDDSFIALVALKNEEVIDGGAFSLIQIVDVEKNDFIVND